MDVKAKSPNECSPQELVQFEALVLEGGEVDPIGLAGRIRCAVALAFLLDEGAILGVAGLKEPSVGYRAKVMKGALTSIPADRYPFELGWVYVCPGIRGGKSKMLCEALVLHAPGRGMFATSRVNNPWMHATLEGKGFKRTGAEWPSGQNSAKLALFLFEPTEKTLQSSS
ncbi:hypothetical protein [Variovorax sp. V15]|uniref:hypothetical protein n=1 Tax=Variovorax sp. V15 TaxID=3065952 RepID=UPI0034E8A3D7